MFEHVKPNTDFAMSYTPLSVIARYQYDGKVLVRRAVRTAFFPAYHVLFTRRRVSHLLGSIFTSSPWLTKAWSEYV